MKPEPKIEPKEEWPDMDEALHMCHFTAMLKSSTEEDELEFSSYLCRLL